MLTREKIRNMNIEYSDKKDMKYVYESGIYNIDNDELTIKWIDYEDGFIAILSEKKQLLTYTFEELLMIRDEMITRGLIDEIVIASEMINNGLVNDIIIKSNREKTNLPVTNTEDSILKEEFRQVIKMLERRI